MDWTFLWGKQTNLQTQRKRRHCHFENLWKTNSRYCRRSFAKRLSLKGLCHGSPVHFVLFSQLLALDRAIAMELKVGKEITSKWQNQRLETNKYVSWALFLKPKTAELNFEKLLGWTVFKNHNFNPFQSSSVLPIGGSCCICCVNRPLKFQAVIFMFLLDLTGIL